MRERKFIKEICAYPEKEKKMTTLNVKDGFIKNSWAVALIQCFWLKAVWGFAPVANSQNFLHRVSFLVILDVKRLGGIKRFVKGVYYGN